MRLCWAEGGARAFERLGVDQHRVLVGGEHGLLDTIRPEAIQVARSGLELDPANPELRALISVALAELGDVERAHGRVAREAEQRTETDRWKEQASGSADPVAYTECAAEAHGDQRGGLALAREDLLHVKVGQQRQPLVHLR